MKYFYMPQPTGMSITIKLMVGYCGALCGHPVPALM